MSQLKFTAYCRPEPQGSTKGFVLRGKFGAKDRAILTSANKNLKPFRGQVTREAMAALLSAGLPQPMAGKHVPVSLVMDFYFERPPSIPKKRRDMVVKPDLDKLVRSTTDALTGLLYADDAQIIEASVRKHYGTPERVEVSATIIGSEAHQQQYAECPAELFKPESALI